MDESSGNISSEYARILNLRGISPVSLLYHTQIRLIWLNSGIIEFTGFFNILAAKQGFYYKTR